MSDETATIADPNAPAASNAPAATSTPPAGQNATTAPGGTSAGPSSADWAKGWVKEDGSLDNSVFDRAPDEFKAQKKDIERYKTLPDYLKGQRAHMEMLGKKGLVDPLPANATPEQVAERSTLLRKVNGAPEKPEGYGLARPEAVPAEMWNQKLADEVSTLAFKHALPPAAVKELADLQLRATQEGMAAQKQAETAWFDGQDKLIRDNLTKDGTDYAKGLDAAQRAGRRWGVAPDSPLLKNATVFLLLNRLAKAGEEAGLVKGEQDHFGVNPSMTNEQAEAAADDIMRNKANPLHKAYWDGNHPDNAKAKEKWRSLREMAKKGKPDRTTAVARA